MKPGMLVTGDELIGLLGQPVGAPNVQLALGELARGMQPVLDQQATAPWVDWVTVNEIGLEFGFEDEALVLALDTDHRGQGPVLLTQLYFYGDTARTMPFPFALPFGLDLADDRAIVHRKLSRYESLRRSFKRDAWQLPDFHLTIAYRSDNGCVESVLCHVPHAPWPIRADEAELVAPFTPEALSALFGARWSSALLRKQLGPLGYAAALPDVRSEHCADLRMSHGIEFSFAPGDQLVASDRQFPHALALASVTYYGARVYDGREWQGPMPLKLSFADSQTEIAAKLGRRPDDQENFDRTGFAIWHFDRYSVRVEYSNIENHLLRASILAPGYWLASGAGSVGKR